jgi:hypothetical protein
MRHPLQKVPDGRKSLLLLILLSLTGGLMAILSRTLRREPYSIVDLELAGNKEEVQRILDAWDASGVRGLAFLNVYVNFLFLCVYSTTIALACVTAATVRSTHDRVTDPEIEAPCRAYSGWQRLTAPPEGPPTRCR